MSQSDSQDAPNDNAPNEDVPEQGQEVSLDELSAAFAQVMGSIGRTPEAADTEAADARDDSEGQQQTHEDRQAGGAPEGLASPPGDNFDQRVVVQAAIEVTPLGIIEAMLFVGSADNTSLSAEEAASAMRDVDASEIHDLVSELNRRYASNRSPYHIVSQGAGYRLKLRDEFSRLRDRFYGRVRRARLSQAAIDVLAIVAYNQPVSRETVDQCRGVPSSAILFQLVRRRLLHVEHDDGRPRQRTYRTTPRFLDLLGLGSLDDLPQARDLEPQ